MNVFGRRIGTHMPCRRKSRQILLGLDLGLAVGAHAVERGLLGDRVLVVGAVDGGRGDVDHAVDARVLRGPKHVAGTVDSGVADTLVVPERERRGGVDDRVRARLLERGGDRFLVANVALDELDAFDLVLGFEGLQVERRDVPAALLEVLTGVEAQKAGAAGDEKRAGLGEPLVRLLLCLHCPLVHDGV